MLDFFSNILPQLNDKNSFQTLGEKIWPLVLNSPVTFVPGSVRCSSALCLYIFLLNHLPVCVHVYQCMYMSTSVCTCLPVCVNVYHHGAVQLIDTHISGTQTPNVFFRQISQLKTSIRVSVFFFLFLF